MGHGPGKSPLQTGADPDPEGGSRNDFLITVRCGVFQYLWQYPQKMFYK